MLDPLQTELSLGCLRETLGEENQEEVTKQEGKRNKTLWEEACLTS